MAVLKFVALGAAALIALYFTLALALIFWPASPFKGQPAPAAPGSEYPHTEQRFAMRDGKTLFARVFGSPADTSILLVHGFGVDSHPYEEVASLWQAATGACVYTLDLRGHGRSDGTPGRIDYVGQYQNDLADVISALRKSGARRIILAGHSMGGGIVLTYALKAHAPPVDAYLLLAPLLGNNAPTAARPGVAAERPSNLYVRTPRIFGELMLTIVGIRAFEDLPVLYLNQAPKMMTYNFAAVSSMAPGPPRDYKVAFGTITVPLLVVAGSADEVFRGPAYVDVVKTYSHGGQAVLVPGATHFGVLSDPAAVAAIKEWVARTTQVSESP